MPTSDGKHGADDGRGAKKTVPGEGGHLIQTRKQGAQNELNGVGKDFLADRNG